MAAREFRLPPSIPTMVSDEELGYLYRLARDAWDGQGSIVEMGPWLGGSTWALASGMEANPRRGAGGRLHVIDNFIWQPFMEDRAPIGLGPGESFRSEFESNLRSKENLLVVHEAALPDDDSCDQVHDVGFVDARWDVPVLTDARMPSRVDIAFVDGAKSWQGLMHFMKLLAPRLSVGESLIVFQDFKNWSSYWVPLYVSMLLEADDRCLELVDVLEKNSVTFRMHRPLLETMENALPASLHALSPEDARALFGRAAKLLGDAGDPGGALVVRLADVAFVGSAGDWELAVQRLRAVERRWPLRGGPLNQLERTRAWLERNASRDVPRSTRLRLTETLKRRGRVLRPRRA